MLTNLGATEILKEGVMLFVNEIGDICHGIVDKYSGAANKNVGDAKETF